MKDTIESLAVEMAAKFPGVTVEENAALIRKDIENPQPMRWSEDERQWGELGKRLNEFIRVERMKRSQ